MFICPNFNAWYIYSAGSDVNYKTPPPTSLFPRDYSLRCYPGAGSSQSAEMQQVSHTREQPAFNLLLYLEVDACLRNVIRKQWCRVQVTGVPLPRTPPMIKLLLGFVSL